MLAMESLPTKLSPETIARAAIDYYHADGALLAALNPGAEG
jgi:hypothetical protein